MEVALLVSVVSLGALWIGFFWLYRDYRLDLFRQRLFALRDELFDIARCGDIAFGAPAYGMLRCTINGTIRFGHKCGLLDLASCVFLMRNSIERARANEYHQRWQAALSQVGPQTRAKLLVLRGRLHYLMVEQVFFTSLVLTATLVPLAAWVIVRVVGVAMSRAIRKVLGDRFIDDLGDRMDCAALVASDDGASSTARDDSCLVAN